MNHFPRELHVDLHYQMNPYMLDLSFDLLYLKQLKQLNFHFLYLFSSIQIHLVVSFFGSRPNFSSDRSADLASSFFSSSTVVISSFQEFRCYHRAVILHCWNCLPVLQLKLDRHYLKPLHFVPFSTIKCVCFRDW
eukprot:UN12222